MLRDGKAEVYKYGMAEFMPADGEEFERDNHHSCTWDGPQTEEHHRINDYLCPGFKHRGKRGLMIREGNALRRAQ